jgi:predicted metal-dependent phosphoesterase TrpH
VRGNLHTHSDRSDGAVPPERVLADYRAAGYDFLVLTDHFEARWGWTVTDTSAARDAGFTTLLGAELSSAGWDDEDVFWVNAIGLPADFPAPSSPELAVLAADGHRRRRAARVDEPGVVYAAVTVSVWWPGPVSTVTSAPRLVSRSS